MWTSGIDSRDTRAHCSLAELVRSVRTATCVFRGSDRDVLVTPCQRCWFAPLFSNPSSFELFSCELMHEISPTTSLEGAQKQLCAEKSLQRHLPSDHGFAYASSAPYPLLPVSVTNSSSSSARPGRRRRASRCRGRCHRGLSANAAGCQRPSVVLGLYRAAYSDSGDLRRAVGRRSGRLRWSRSAAAGGLSWPTLSAAANSAI